VRSLACLVLGIAFALSGCESMRTMFASPNRDAAKGPSPGLVAPLRGLGSAVSGKVRVIDRGDGITLLVSAINLPIGEYRVAFHHNGNCSSPNGFSAGPAWAPEGKLPAALIPPLRNGDGNAEASVHVAGIHTTGEYGLAGRSVLLYSGSTIEDVQPGVRNNVIACGVFEPAQTLLF
jgi:Cu/Zn superoxide dismutase